MNYKSQAGNFAVIFWFIFLLVLTTIGLVAGVVIFFGEEYDFRQVDSDILNKKINDCLQKKEIDLEAENFSREIEKKCSLNLEVIKEDYFLLIKKDENILFDVGQGDETQCALAEKNINFPRCSNSTLTIENNLFFIQAGSSQKRREVAA